MTNDSVVDDKIFMEKEILLPFSHIATLPSKLFRKRISLAFNHWLKLSDERVNYIVDTIHMLHVGTLLIDDIQDDTRMRRDTPAAHLVYGVPITINASLHIIMLTLEKLLVLQHPKVASVYCEGTLEIARGQGIEIYWRDNFKCPTEKQFEDMIKQKTGHMIAMGPRIMQLFSDNNHDYTELVLLVALYFQIRDDYCNLMKNEEIEEWPKFNNGRNEQINKYNFCEDLTEGKFTLPIIHASKQPGGEAVLNILRQRTKDINLKQYCVSVLESLGSMEYTRERLRQLDRQIRNEIEKLGGNPELIAIMNALNIM
ncbi:terpene synthase-like isoform X1 [Leptidea sinapis]|uniref:terpene synthase-like isoform X1 n=1 Tax=Leptidea sinapis TaxID=189913 RepID=UPI00212242BD|nr:terpene synthase-like isoform X1 [Leptidea sinapis]